MTAYTCPGLALVLMIYGNQKDYTYSLWALVTSIGNLGSKGRRQRGLLEGLGPEFKFLHKTITPLKTKGVSEDAQRKRGLRTLPTIKYNHHQVFSLSSYCYQ